MTKPLIHKQLSRPSAHHVPASVARELLRLVATYEGDARAFLVARGLTHLSALLTSGAGAPERIAHRDFTLLYAHATAVLDIHAAHQEGRDSLTKSGVDMMCHAIITARTLREAVGRLASFSVLLAPRTGQLRLETNGHIAQLNMATVRRVRNDCSYLSDLTGLSYYHRLLGWLIGEDIPLLGVRMRYPPLLEAQTVAYLLPHPVEHHAPENGLRFAADVLDRPVVRTPSELDLLLPRFPFDIQEPQSKVMPLSERIAHVFAAMLPGGEAFPTAADLASRFSISVATLKRRLASEGMSLSQIKAAARRDLAMQLLGDPRIGVAEVARRARFSDAGAFRRAFHQWTGMAPTAWRAGQGALPASRVAIMAG